MSPNVTITSVTNYMYLPTPLSSLAQVSVHVTSKSPCHHQLPTYALVQVSTSSSPCKIDSGIVGLDGGGQSSKVKDLGWWVHVWGYRGVATDLYIAAWGTALEGPSWR